MPFAAAELRTDLFGGMCAYCPAPATTWDHLVPVRLGGDTTPDNIVPCCISCNSAKKDRNVLEWLERTARPDTTQKLEVILWLLRGQGVLD